MNAWDINNNRRALEALIEKALMDSMLWIESRCKPQEPDYVMALSTKFLSDFYNILVAVFLEYGFSVSGVYCHQKPIVDINLGKMPELGDILFVYTDRKKNGEKIMNSLLLQAKISNRSYLKIQPSEMHQLELYKKWPEFTYHKAGRLNGKKRNILPKTINDGAQYLLIDNDPRTNGVYGGRWMFPMGCAVPDDILYVNDSLSAELTDFLKFKSGRTVDSNPYSTEDDWSKMIWDLLRIGACSISKRKNAGIKSFPRSREYVHLCTEDMQGWTLLEEALGDYGKGDLLFDGDTGVSVISVESRWRTEQEM